MGDGYNSELIYLVLVTYPFEKIIAHCTFFTETLKIGSGIEETIKLLEGQNGTSICGEVKIESIYKRIGEIKVLSRQDAIPKFDGIISPCLSSSSMATASFFH